MTDTFEKEYTADVVDIIEFLYGKNYLSQGGPESVDRMLKGLDLTDKVIADIGCGTGGPLIHIAQHYPIQRAIGIDVDPDLLNTAEQNSADLACEWLQSKPEHALPLENASIDLIIGKESWLHIQNKDFFFQELFRVLKPGGSFVNIDWMHHDSNYSDLMKTFVNVDGLSFNLCTIEEYLETIQKTGFTSIQHEENSHYALEYSRKDVDQLCNAHVVEQFIERFGEQALSDWRIGWLMQCEVFARGEMRTFWVRAERP